ncbi:MAG: carboxypeptidase-like regulatory domain-containing protein, partial [Chloroflexota bacterium]
MSKYLLPFLILLAFTVKGQNHAMNGTIKGRVFDAASNEPLPFTNLVVYGTTQGTTADLDGNFTITNIHPGFIKVAATIVGFENFISEEIQVTNAKVVYMDIPMVKANIQLDEIVVKASPFRKPEE